LCACLPAWADQPPELSEVVVTATRVDTGVLESPAAVTVITQEQISASSAQDVAGLINGTAGVVVNDGGPTGAVQTVSLRGSTSEQVLVLVDGMRLNSSRDGTVDLSTIPLESIDHIEIVRAADSALYGSSAIGGVINIITKKAAKTRITLGITNGSYIPHNANEVSSSGTQTAVSANPLDLVDNQNVDLSLAGKLGDVGLTGGGSFTRAANGYTWDDTTDINAWRRMTNADSLSGSGYVGLNAPVFGGELGVKGTVDLSDSGEPGSLTLISDAARQDDTSAMGSVSWKTDHFFTNALTLDLKGFYRYDELAYNDPAWPPASLHRTSTAGVDVTQKLTLSDLLSAVYGGSAYYDYVDSTNYSIPEDRLNLAGFVSVPLSPVEPLTITPSVRYDYFSDFTGSLSYSLSAVYLLSDQSSLRASLGSAYRVPTLNDLYWYDPSGYTAANPDLKPETSYNGELGWSLALQKLSVDASVFTRLVNNNIVWLAAAPTYVYTPENLYETLYPGAEIHAKLAITDRISLEASETFDYSFLLNDGTTAYTLADNVRVPYAPVNTLGAEARYVDKVQSGGVKLRWVTDQYTDVANSTVIPGYVVVDVDYRIATSDKLAFTITAKNIFDTLYYTQQGYPMPPFSLEAGLSLHM
jgi:outer membrane cobalamin receptor